MLQGYFGDPYTSCRAECLSHGDCPSSRPSCINSKCMDPCAGVCGVNANCRVKDGTTAICSCPRHMTGNPFVSCRPFEKSKSSSPHSWWLVVVPYSLPVSWASGLCGGLSDRIREQTDTLHGGRYWAAPFCGKSYLNFFSPYSITFQTYHVWLPYYSDLRCITSRLIEFF